MNYASFFMVPIVAMTNINASSSAEQENSYHGVSIYYPKTDSGKPTEFVRPKVESSRLIDYLRFLSSTARRSEAEKGTLVGAVGAFDERMEPVEIYTIRCDRIGGMSVYYLYQDRSNLATCEEDLLVFYERMLTKEELEQLHTILCELGDCYLLNN